MASFESRILTLAASAITAKLGESGLKLLQDNVPLGLLTGSVFAGAIEGYVNGKPHSVVAAAKSGLGIFLFSVCTSGTNAGPETKGGAHLTGKALDGVPLLGKAAIKARIDNAPGAATVLAMLVFLSVGSYIGAEIRKQQKDAGFKDFIESAQKFETKLAERYEDKGAAPLPQIQQKQSEQKAAANPSVNLKTAFALCALAHRLNKKESIVSV